MVLPAIAAAAARAAPALLKAAKPAITSAAKHLPTVMKSLSGSATKVSTFAKSPQAKGMFSKAMQTGDAASNLGNVVSMANGHYGVAKERRAQNEGVAPKKSKAEALKTAAKTALKAIKNAYNDPEMRKGMSSLGGQISEFMSHNGSDSNQPFSSGKVHQRMPKTTKVKTD